MFLSTKPIPEFSQLDPVARAQRPTDDQLERQQVVVVDDSTVEKIAGGLKSRDIVLVKVSPQEAKRIGVSQKPGNYALGAQAIDAFMIQITLTHR